MPKTKEELLSEIQRFLDEFQERFKDKSTDPDNFLTIFDIESMWAELVDKTNVLYSDYLNKMVADIDQKALVAKKKESMQKKE